ncbi:unnamed protein product [Effrenium voratum]|nr:unnamed protein product [Effrenium voratum]
MRFDRQPSRNSLAIQDNRDLVAVVERNLSELDLEPRSRRTMSSKELVQARSRASSRDSRRRSPGSSRSSSKSSVHNSRPSSRKGSKTRNFSKASNASHASRSTEAEREVKEKTERDRKLSSGAALGLDLAIFEHRKSRSEKEQTPREQSRRVSSVSEFSASSKKSTLRSEGGEETFRAVPKAKPETPAATFRELMKAKAREAYQKRRKLTSTNLEPDLKDPVFLPAQHLLPKSVSALDVPTAIDFFDHYDKVRAHGNSGLLDRKALAEMLYAIGQGKDAMSTEWSDAIFKELDFQHCGQLDKEQFLGWAFSCRNNYHSDVRRRFHAVVDDEQLHELVRQGMASGSGLAKDVLVTKEDLWFLVETCYVQLSRVANDQLHAYLANGSESVSAQQLLNWLYPGRELRELQAKFEALRQQMPDLEEPEFELPTAEGFQRPKRPLWEPSLKQPVVLKFTIASAFRGKIKYLQENLGAFSELQLKIHVAA